MPRNNIDDSRNYSGGNDCPGRIIPTKREAWKRWQLSADTTDRSARQERSDC